MFNRNALWAGLVIGILFPVIGFLLLYNLFGILEAKGAASGEGFSANFRERTVAIVALALNLIPLNIYRKRRWDLSMRGVVVATAVMAFVWLYKYGVYLF